MPIKTTETLAWQRPFTFAQRDDVAYLARTLGAVFELGRTCNHANSAMTCRPETSRWCPLRARWMCQHSRTPRRVGMLTERPGASELIWLLAMFLGLFFSFFHARLL